MEDRSKVAHVLRQYKQGTLHSSSGQKVADRKQAVAIAMSEAGMSRRKAPKRKRSGRIGSYLREHMNR